MSDYNKNLENFEIFRKEYESYFEHYTYIYFKNKNDFMLWFITDNGDFTFGYLKDLGIMSFFFDAKKEADEKEWTIIKNLLVEKCGMKVYDLSDEELIKLKQKIKRYVKNPEIVPEGVMPEKKSRIMKGVS